MFAFNALQQKMLPAEFVPPPASCGSTVSWPGSVAVGVSYKTVLEFHRLHWSPQTWVIRPLMKLSGEVIRWRSWEKQRHSEKTERAEVPERHAGSHTVRRQESSVHPSLRKDLVYALSIISLCSSPHCLEKFFLHMWDSLPCGFTVLRFLGLTVTGHSLSGGQNDLGCVHLVSHLSAAPFLKWAVLMTGQARL